jgi:hypothetical protein
MTFNLTTAKALSSQLRAKYASLDSQAKLVLQDALLEATGAKNRRSVQLWLTDSPTKRNFLNRSCGAEEYERRESITRALLSLNPMNVPTKTKAAIGDRKEVSSQLAEYFTHDYTGKALRKITIQGTSFSIQYDAYYVEPDGSEEPDDRDLIEFDDKYLDTVNN